MNYVNMLEYCTNDEQKIELLRRSKMTQCYHAHHETKKRIFFFYWCEESERMIVVNPRGTTTKVRVYSPRQLEKQYPEESLLVKYYRQLMDLHKERTNGPRRRTVLSLSRSKTRPTQA